MRFSIYLPGLLSLVLAATARADLAVLACEPEWAALAREIGGDRVRVDSATIASQDPHHVQARPSLIAKARRADLLVCTGAGLEEGWLPLLLRKSGNAAIQPGRPGHLMLAERLELREIPAELDRAQGDIHAAGNPHVQTDPRNIAHAAGLIGDRLASLDPDNAETYRDRQQSFVRRWNEAEQRWLELARPLRDLPVVVHHRSWIYLQDWLGLDEVAALEPIPGIPPGSGHLAEVLERVGQAGARVIIRSQYEDARAAEWLADRSGIPAVVLPSTVGGTSDAGDLFSWFPAIIGRLLVAVAAP